MRDGSPTAGTTRRSLWSGVGVDTHRGGLCGVYDALAGQQRKLYQSDPAEVTGLEVL